MSEPNGKAPPEPSPEEQEAMKEAFLNLLQNIASEVKSFQPHLSDEVCLQAADKSLKVQQELTPFVQGVLDKTRADELPRFGFQFLLSKDKKLEPLVCNKDFEKVESREEMLVYLATMGLMLYPGLRAMLIAKGWWVHYLEVKAASPIIQLR